MYSDWHFDAISCRLLDTTGGIHNPQAQKIATCSDIASGAQFS